MYEVKTAEYNPENIIAGDFPVVKDFGTIKNGVAIRKYAPIMSTDEGITEAAVSGIDDLIGIAADEPSNDSVVYYLTGEFFAAAIPLPDGITVDDIKPVFRRLGIFLK